MGLEVDPSPGYMRLHAWQAADDLAVQLFHVAKSLPSDTRWLCSQMVRAATSAPANIAEGYGRASNKEFLQHLAVAHGSLQEVGYYIHFMRRTELLNAETCKALKAQYESASRLVYGLMKSVRTDTRQPNSKRRYLRENMEAYAANDDE